MKIGSNISQLRTAQKIEKTFMAQELNISVEEYEAIERDERDITLSMLEAISRLLSLEVADLITLNKPITGIRNFFFNHNGNSGVNIHVQGIDQEKIRQAYKELYAEELNRIPKLEKLLRQNNIEFDF
ncbi:helix-turn-helix transcriptional regulator [Chitinophaga sp. 212800010-3]|uniref:helix-turn-helix domain-containing protein n=1 Tax=Bacteroidota TaxID=976 RepID=UPI001AC74A9D|nr:helix-turn-helix transcriptional regulator [Chitinophaga sp. 212800010-3]MBN8880598.1 helix-turn-helix transcriptional regulator [Sphingobacteriales bacterium]MBN9484363.1 helix-turn-helix transcriptional regulator [Bacteroidota bacterium]MEC5143547.1 HTH cro/C1-type domain-containing protein [Chitinophaga sp. 212800010-3]